MRISDLSADVCSSERSIELLFENADARAYRRLGPVQVRGGGDEAPGLQDLQERTGGGDIHGSIFLPLSGNSIQLCLFDQSHHYHPTLMNRDEKNEDRKSVGAGQSV